MSKGKGIYCWLNKINNKRYIGQTGCKGGFDKRWAQERYYLNHSMAERLNKHFCAAWNKYGEQSFEPLILETINPPTKELLTEREQYWCDFYRTNDPTLGYNHRLCADSNLGSKLEISEAMQSRASILSMRFAGEKSPSAKLSWEQVREIRQKYSTKAHSMLQLAEEYGMNRKTIEALIHNKTWKDPEYTDPGNCMRRKRKLYRRPKKPRLTENKVRLIRDIYAKGDHTYEQVAEFFGIVWTQVYNIVKRKAWKNIV